MVQHVYSYRQIVNFLEVSRQKSEIVNTFYGYLLHNAIVSACNFQWSLFGDTHKNAHPTVHVYKHWNDIFKFANHLDLSSAVWAVEPGQRVVTRGNLVWGNCQFGNSHLEVEFNPCESQVIAVCSEIYSDYATDSKPVHSIYSMIGWTAQSDFNHFNLPTEYVRAVDILLLKP